MTPPDVPGRIPPPPPPPFCRCGDVLHTDQRSPTGYRHANGRVGCNGRDGLAYPATDPEETPNP